MQLITLGVADLDSAREFYVNRLGWRPLIDVPGEVLFVQVGHGVAISFFVAEKLSADMGVLCDPVSHPAFNLGHICVTEQEVRNVVEQFRAGGGTVLKEPGRADFGGNHSYVTDPNGFVWELATNPGWSVDDDGVITLVPVV